MARVLPGDKLRGGFDRAKVKNYYNENDPRAAAWLRELIKHGHIAPGEVDERSIVDVKPYELTRYTQQHFFAGIGGWSLALRLAGWPDDQPVRTGSCPCQPFSQAGSQLGTKDARHLWPVFRDLITFGDATITFGEQVASPLGREWLAGVRDDLEGLGYEVGAADLCAAGVAAPHIRQRLYWVAHPNRRGLNSRCRNKSKAQEQEGGNGEFEQRGGADGMAHRDGEGRARSNRKSQPEEAAEARSCSQHLVRNGQLIGVGFSNSTGRESRQSTIASTGQWNHTQPASGAGRMAHARHDAGRPELVEPLSECDCRAWKSGAWDNFLIVHCSDGKARRFEPGSFPLAYGIPHRVGKLRGYGNAIVPQVAAEFILAAVESLDAIGNQA